MSQLQTNRIKVANPPIEDEVRAYLTTDCVSGATTLETLDNAGFTLDGTDDYYILIGEYGSEKAEIILVDVSDAATNNTGFKISATKYSHEASDPVTFIRYNKIVFYGAVESGGTKVPLDTEVVSTSAKDLDPSQLYTEYVYTGETYNYFYTAYYNSNDDNLSAYSDEIRSGSYTRRSVKRIIESGLRKALTSIDKGVDAELNWDTAIETVQDGIDEILIKKRTWSFLRTIDDSKTTTPNQKYIEKPSDLIMLEFIKINSKKIDLINRNKYNDYTSANVESKGTPFYYIQKNDKYYLYPTPDKAYDVSYEYYKTIATITSDLSTEIDLPFVPILIYYCASQFAYIRGNDKRGDKTYGMFSKLLDEQAIEYSGPEQTGEAEEIERTSIYGDNYEII